MKPLVLDFKDIDRDIFLAEYWQQKPLLMRSALADFEDLIAPDELAGLAAIEAVESRLIKRQGDTWHAESGPFESYEHLGEKDWTLVVQAADNWSPEVAALLDAFDFLPDWRRDDVMISFATESGSVGPHIDNYDTFICQGSGSRHWRVGDNNGHSQYSAHELLLHVEPFDAIIDAELQPGDILYIPPGYPHEGISLCPSMSFSVGYRTQSVKDMLSALADYLIDRDLGNELLCDPERKACRAPGLIDKEDVARLKNHLSKALEDEDLLAAFASQYLSEPKHTLDAPEQPMDYEPQEVRMLLQSQPMYRLGGLRCHYNDSEVQSGVFYVNGERFELSASLAPSIRNLCDHRLLTEELLSQGLDDPEFMGLLTELVNQGCWYFEQC